MGNLGLPNLPIHFPTHAACPTVAQVKPEFGKQTSRSTEGTWTASSTSWSTWWECSAHAYIQMFVYVCRTGQSNIWTISVGLCGSELGLTILKGLSCLYNSLVWESTVLWHSAVKILCQPDVNLAKLIWTNFFLLEVISFLEQQLLVLNPRWNRNWWETFSPSSGKSAGSNATNAMDALSTNGAETAIEVDKCCNNNINDKYNSIKDTRRVCH